jgi:hypothetical protein
MIIKGRNMKMKLAVLWLALMLVYLLGDVLRVFAGDFVPGEIGGKTMSQMVWLGAAIVMLIPIIMMVLNVFFANENLTYANTIATSVLFLFNAFGLPSYKSPYDKFLIIVGLIINIVIGVYVWKK